MVIWCTKPGSEQVSNKNESVRDYFYIQEVKSEMYKPMTFQIAIQEGQIPFLCRERQIPYNKKEVVTAKINKLVD